MGSLDDLDSRRRTVTKAIAWKRTGWRWGAVLATVALLCALPVAIAALPVRAPHIAPDRLLRSILASADRPYQGMAESRAHLGLPDVRRAQHQVELLSQTTRMRVWYRNHTSWRVDEISPIGESDWYMDPLGLTVWNSEGRSETRIKGTPTVRFLRAADLLPPELGRRIAAEALPSEVSTVSPRRVAGVGAPGIEIKPHSAASTVDAARIWADPVTGIPLEVEIQARGSSEPVFAGRFLDFSRSAPTPDVVSFVSPPDASFSFTMASDFAQEVQRFSPFILPDAIGARPRRAQIGGSTGTFGRGFNVIAVLMLSARYSPLNDSDVQALPPLKGWDDARMIRTPLVNAMVINQNGIAYVLGGAITPHSLKKAARDLVSATARAQRQVDSLRRGDAP